MNSAAINKTFKATFDLIKQINTSRKFQIKVGQMKNHPFTGMELAMLVKEDAYNFSVSTLVRKGRQSRKEFTMRRSTEVVLKNPELSLFIQGGDLLVNLIQHPGFDDPDAVPTKLVSGELVSISNRKNAYFKQKHFYRVLIPVERGIRLFREFTGVGFTTESKNRSGPLLPMVISGINYHFYVIQNAEQQAYFAVDCLEKEHYQNFMRAVNSILLTYAFLKGQYPTAQAYIITYTSRDLSKPTAIKTIGLTGGQKGFAIHTTNPYNIVQISDKIKFHIDERGVAHIHDKHLDKYRIPFPDREFGKLCDLIYSHYGILRGVLLYVNHNSLGLELKIPTLFVSIETITKVLSGSSTGDLKIFQDTNIENALKLVTTESLKLIKEIERTNQPTNPSQEEHKNYQSNFDRIRGKINTLNRGSNNQKLFEPFTALGYDLSTEEKELLARQRNIFLHGEEFLPQEESNDREFRELFHISLRLQKMIAVLLLKKVGYSGYILNNAKIYEHVSVKKLKEPYFVKI